MRIVFTDSVEAQQEKKQHCFMFAILHRAQVRLAIEPELGCYMLLQLLPDAGLIHLLCKPIAAQI